MTAIDKMPLYEAIDKTTGITYKVHGFNKLHKELYISSVTSEGIADDVSYTVYSVTVSMDDYMVREVKPMDFREKLIAATREVKVLERERHLDYLRDEGFELIESEILKAASNGKTDVNIDFNKKNFNINILVDLIRGDASYNILRVCPTYAYDGIIFDWSGLNDY